MKSEEVAESTTLTVPILGRVLMEKERLLPSNVAMLFTIV
jgi:hypothetical protein